MLYDEPNQNETAAACSRAPGLHPKHGNNKGDCEPPRNIPEHINGAREESGTATAEAWTVAIDGTDRKAKEDPAVGSDANLCESRVPIWTEQTASFSTGPPLERLERAKRERASKKL
jgi:hypothetical protein